MSLRPAGSSRGRKKTKKYKAVVEVEEARRWREEGLVEIRKIKGEGSLTKKQRDVASSAPAAVSSAGCEALNAAGQSSAPDGCQKRDSKPPSLAVEGKLEFFSEMVQQMWSEDVSAQIDATTYFRKHLSTHGNPPIDEVIKAGVVLRLVQFLSRQEQPNLQIEAAWALAILASGTSEYTRLVIEHAAIPFLTELLGSPCEEVREQAIRALGNIARVLPSSKDLILENGVLIPLLSLLNPQSKSSTIRSVTWALSNLCYDMPLVQFEQMKAALSVLQQIIQSDDEEILEDACWALSYLCDGDNKKMQVVTDTNICSRLVELLQHPTPSVLIPALRTVGNIVSGDDSQTQIVIDDGVLPYLPQLLTQTHEKNIKREACWTISNITAGNKAQIQAVLDADIIPPLVHLLKHGEFDIKKEAAWAISNVTSGGSFEQIHFLVGQGCIEPLCDLLQCPDSRIVMVCLGALDNILMVGEAEKDLCNSGGINVYAGWVHDCEGLEKIEDLQRHDNSEVYEKAVEMLERYWDEGGEERYCEGLEQQHGLFESGQDAAVPAGVFKSVMAAVSLV